MKKLFLVRHGTVHNPNNVIYRRLPGYILGEQGRLEAAQASLFLATEPIRTIWHSPLERAVETAELINIHHHAPMQIDERIHEWDLGEGEDVVGERMAAFLEDWRASDYPVSAAVSHRDPIRRLLFHIAGRTPAMDDLEQFPLLQAGIYLVTELEDGALTVKQVFTPDVVSKL